MKILIDIYKKSPSFIKHLIERLIKKYDGGEQFSKKLRILYKKVYGIDVGIGSYGCFDSNKIAPHITIGNYCSFAQNVSIVPRREHPLYYASTSPLFFNSVWGFVENDKVFFESLIINNDVWIGQNVVICSKCTSIGNGAVIAAGSIVTKSVPEYAIVAGVPARVIRYRFSECIIKKLNISRWYELPLEELKKFVNVADNPDNFAEAVIRYRGGVKSGI